MSNNQTPDVGSARGPWWEEAVYLRQELQKAREQVSWLTAEVADARIKHRAERDGLAAQLRQADEANRTLVQMANERALDSEAAKKAIKVAMAWRNATLSPAAGWAQARLDLIEALNAYQLELAP